MVAQLLIKFQLTWMHKQEACPWIPLFAAVFEVNRYRNVMRGNGSGKEIGMRIGNVVRTVGEVRLAGVFIERLDLVVDLEQLFEAQPGTQPF